jgi:polar amino acid transport system ATP-binding protein
MVFQSFNLFPHLNVLKNLTIAQTKVLKRSEEEAREVAQAVMERVGLLDKIDEYPIRLSGGQQQRVAIARALAKDPVLVLADEPTANLDAKRGHEVMELLRQRALETDKAVIIVSHDHRIRDIADRVMWLEDGCLQPAP